MDESIGAMRRLSEEIGDHLQSPAMPARTAALAKRESIAAIASTLAFTIRAKGR